MTAINDQPIYQTLIEKLEALRDNSKTELCCEVTVWNEAIAECIATTRTHLSNQPPVDADLRAIDEKAFQHALSMNRGKTFSVDGGADECFRYFLSCYQAALQGGVTISKSEYLMLKCKANSTLGNNLCPDHRDKQAGKRCLACEIEGLERRLQGTGGELDVELARLRMLLSLTPDSYKELAKEYMPAIADCIGKLAAFKVKG